MDQWKTLSKNVILKGNRFLTVENHTVQLPDGRVIADWPWIITPDFVNVVAVTGEGRFLCFRQTKYAIEGTSLAPIGGYMEPGEPAQSAAQRELLEETGYESDDWAALGSYPVDANRGCGTGNFFLARNARRVAAPKKDDLEEQELLELTREEIDAAMAKNEFRILPWVTAVIVALRYLDGEK